MSSDQDSAPAISPRMVVMAILRRKALFAVLLVAGLAATLYVALRWQFTYITSFKLLVQPEARQRLDLVAAAQRGMPIADHQSGMRTEFLNAAQILQSTDLIDRLAHEIIESDDLPFELNSEPDSEGPVTARPIADSSRYYQNAMSWIRSLVFPPDYDDRDKTPKEVARDFLGFALARSVHVEPISQTTVIDVSVVWGDPIWAYRIARRLTSLCQSQYQSMNPLAEGIRRLEKLVKSNQERLDVNRKRQFDVLLQANATDLDRAIAQNDERIADLETEHFTCTVEISAANRKEVQLDKALNVTPKELDSEPEWVSNPVYSVLYGSLHSLELQSLTGSQIRGEASGLETAKAAVREKLEKEKPFLERRGLPRPNPDYNTLKQSLLLLRSESTGTKAKCDVIDSQLQALKLRSRELLRRQAELFALKREEDLIKSRLLNHQQSLNVATIFEDQSPGARLKIIQMPQMSRTPTGNRRPLLLLGGMIASLFGAAMVCLIAYRARAEIHRVEDVESASTDTRVIGVIPESVWWNTHLLSRLRRK